MGARNQSLTETKFDGTVIVDELIRNMELGQFQMAYAVLLPCVFTVYLHPEDHSNLTGVFDLVIDDAKKALRARVAQLNAQPTVLGVSRAPKGRKEYKIACIDWSIQFLPHDEVPRGDVEIHSELNEAPQPGFRGTKTTLLERSATATVQRDTPAAPESRRPADNVFAEIRYEDESGHQIYLVTQNRTRIGRGGDGQAVELALYTTDEVSREHLVIRRDAATGIFFILDQSKNGTWIDGKRLRKGVEELLPNDANIGVGEVLKLTFQARK
ncbi:MAG: FHA domain-containing protein [Acidobacteriaceae bacterium]|nr:FHA domain-containing protein [Acidobacteriaceae bacterium]